MDKTPIAFQLPVQRAPFAERPGISDRVLIAAACTVLVLSLTLIYMRFFEFERALGAAAHLLSADGIVSLDHRAMLQRALLVVGSAGAAVGLFLIALANSSVRQQIDAVLRWDALRCWELATPNAYWVLASSTLIGLLVVSLWLLQKRLGAFVEYLFIKEGPFENLTFLFDLSSAILCGLAAWQLRTPGRAVQWARMLYFALGVMLFLVAMEEINWGQTFLGFATPAAWSHINYQHETSLHNLADKQALKATWKLVAVAFAVGVIAIVALSARLPRTLIGMIAPAVVLVPLALIASYAGARLHPELIEFLLSVFFAFYSYRIWFAARSSAHDERAAV